MRKLMGMCSCCGNEHEATFDHQGLSGEGSIYAVSCPQYDETTFVTFEGLTVTPFDQLADAAREVMVAKFLEGRDVLSEERAQAARAAAKQFWTTFYDAAGTVCR